MATMEEKKLRQLRLFNNLVYGFASGLYDLFGDSALATIETIGENILEEMEHELGLEIQGEDPQDILTEIERLLVDEFGLVKRAKLVIEGGEIDVISEGCLLWKATEDLKAQNIPPYTCVPMTMASAALRKRMGRRAKFVSLDQDMDQQICNVRFQLLD